MKAGEVFSQYTRDNTNQYYMSYFNFVPKHNDYDCVDIDILPSINHSNFESTESERPATR